MSLHFTAALEFQEEVDISPEEIVRCFEKLEGKDEGQGKVLSEFKENISISDNYAYINLYLPKRTSFRSSREELISCLSENLEKLSRVLYQSDQDTVDVLTGSLYQFEDRGFELVDKADSGQGHDVLVRPDKDTVKRLDKEFMVGRHRYRELVDYFRVKHDFKAWSHGDILGRSGFYDWTGPEQERERTVDGAELRSDEEYENYNYRGGVEDRWVPENRDDQKSE